MALSNAERQKAFRKRRQGNRHVWVSLLVPRECAPELRALQAWLRDSDLSVVSVTIQNPKTGRLESHRL